MNLDIRNIGHYRITSHGGRSFDLFNRDTDKVTSLSEIQYKFCITNGIDEIEELEADINVQNQT
jgi:hypothetical protein